MGLAIFVAGFIIGVFLEGIRSNALMIRMENALQQQYLDEKIKILTNTNLKAMNDEEATKDLPKYKD